MQQPRLRFRRIVALWGALAATAAGAAGWQFVDVDDESNRYSVDDSRIVRDGRLVKAYVRTEYATPREGESEGMRIYAAVDRLHIRCDDDSFALESRSYVMATGEEIPAIATEREDLSFRPAVPGSISAAIVRRLCAKSAVR